MRVLGTCFALLWLTFEAHAAADCVTAPDLAPAVVATAPGQAGPSRTDVHGRVIAPVMVNGQGPYRFMVDTGANRSVLSQELAQALGLTPSGTGEVHSIDSVDVAPLVDVQSLNYGPVPLANAALPILGGAMLAGEQGVLGVDGMQGKRLRLDFEHRCIEIVASQGAPRLRGWETIHGQLRFGHLLLVRAYAGDVRVNVLIDTGSDVSLANTAFRDAVEHVRDWPSDDAYNRIYTAGRPIALGNALVLPHLKLSSVTIDNIVFYVGDYHIFQLWGLTREPTVLIGMDVISHARSIAIDYESATVQIRMPRM